MNVYRDIQLDIISCFDEILSEVGEGNFDSQENVMDALKNLYHKAILRVGVNYVDAINTLNKINVDMYWQEKKEYEEHQETLRQAEKFNNYCRQKNE